ncbi:3-hydroxy-3-methylglutaryl coenzyme A synthase [Neofusicoccum parvum]|nr:3-hydroxy-3-methylglutaryl coenzyme A synthase [Neofusicoccum parvum]
MVSSPRATNVGIKALEVYFPHHYVDQTELERFQGASAGKYTIGLGQTKMSFCDDREDIYSMALTTVSSLLHKYNIDPTTVGRLEVGTESPLDKSKSCKTVLMQLFESSGNTNIEGADTFNACYGGTNALFNAVNWIESSSWDGRDALVVAGDIALYKEAAAKPTGGAGCVAMLIGPDAPLVFDVGKRASFMRHAYDFYKADMSSEYPLVDGLLSIKCYLEAVDGCYKAYQAKVATVVPENGNAANGNSASALVDGFDYMAFHAPNCKLVAKSYARLVYNDSISHPESSMFITGLPAEARDVEYEASRTDKTVESIFMKLSKKRFAERVQPSLLVPTMCGNMYTASVYSSLISIICSVPAAQLRGKRIGLFSYGSGLASSLFSLQVVGDTGRMANILDLHRRLDARKGVAPETYDSMCKMRERAYQKKNYVPEGDIDELAAGTYYLKYVDEKFRRTYAVKGPSEPSDEVSAGQVNGW